MDRKMTQQMNPNPLANYFRQAKLYTPLPSRGRYYADGAIEWPATGEVAIFPMTAKDEMAMRTPDALLNGQSTVDVIKSCIPAVKEPWDIPSIDMDSILISIRMASYGNKMSVEPKCPKCATQNEYELDLTNILAKTLGAEWNDSVQIDELKFGLKPLSYRQINAKSLRTFEEQKLISNLELSEDMDQEVKMQRFNESFKFLTELTLETVIDQVEYISLPDGVVVTDRNHINEFIANADTNIYRAISSTLANNKARYDIPPMKIVCDNEECKNEFEQNLEFDAVNFFGLNS
jgi:hypothetical protein